MIRRNAGLALLLGPLAFGGAPLTGDAQPAAKVYRIGILATGQASGRGNPAFEVFREGLRELGWIEGRNFVIDYRGAENRHDRLPDLAADLVRLKVDIIVCTTGAASVAAKNATATIPIVMMSTGDPVGQGLVASLARPGGNVTGLSFSVGMETFGKPLDLLKQAVPNLRRVAVLWNSANPGLALVLGQLKSTAESLGVQLQFVEAREPNQFDGAFAAMAGKRAEALLVLPDPMFNTNRARLAELAARHRLPAMYGQTVHAEAGGLMAYGPNMSDLFRRSATFVDKILKGAKPGDLPVEQPTKFELVINLKTANALGMTVPQSLLLRADEVIH